MILFIIISVTVNLEATNEEIINAAKIAGIHEFIESIPNKYNTMVGERGLKLSGGEKQRVAIARTVLKNPSVYFFDEATSALDSSTEKKIIKNLEKISKGKTTLIIAHRLSSISKADNIIVLDKGKIVESGNHESLLEKNGLYYRFVEQTKTPCLKNFLSIDIYFIPYQISI